MMVIVQVTTCPSRLVLPIHTTPLTTFIPGMLVELLAIYWWCCCGEQAESCFDANSAV